MTTEEEEGLGMSENFPSLGESLEQIDKEQEAREAEAAFWAMRGAYWDRVAEWCYADKELPGRPPTPPRPSEMQMNTPRLVELAQSDHSEVARRAALPRHAWVVPQLLGQARIITGVYDAHEVIEDSWDYATKEAAMAAFQLYDGTVEPEGWVRHAATSRRRPGGDATKEYLRE